MSAARPVKKSASLILNATAETIGLRGMIAARARLAPVETVIAVRLAGQGGS